jgi:hypothetical protein
MDSPLHDLAVGVEQDCGAIGERRADQSGHGRQEGDVVLVTPVCGMRSAWVTVMSGSSAAAMA